MRRFRHAVLWDEVSPQAEGGVLEHWSMVSARKPRRRHPTPAGAVSMLLAASNEIAIVPCEIPVIAHDLGALGDALSN